MNPRPLGVLLAGLAVACSTSAPAPRRPLSAPSPVVISPDPVPVVPVRAARPVTNPLTGLAPHSAPVVVIKVDNATTARPFHRGLGHAAVVYQELVESGTTRFAAVYDDGWTGEVGPIRSVRETDIELLAQYGRVTVGFSGANKGVMATFQRAVRAGKLLDASYDTMRGPYREGPRRPDAYNFFSTPAKLAKARPGARAKDVGFAFAVLPRGAGTPVSSAAVAFSDYVTVTVRYDRRTGRWAVYQDGRRMPGVAPANVVVQTVPIRPTRYVDVLGARTPYTVTTGRGNVALLRDGRLLRGTWRRLSVRTGTRFLDARGQDLPMKPGPTWVLLQPQRMPTRFG